MGALIQPTSFELGLTKLESTVDHKVVANKDRSVTLTRCWGRSSALWSLPGHYLQVQNIHIVIIILAVPTTKHVHLGASDDVGRVVESRWWRSSSSWSLIPSHGYWVKGIQVLKGLILASFASKDDNPGSCQQRSMSKPRRRWRSLHLWLNPPTRIQIENMRIIQVHITLLLSSIVMPSKVQNRCSNQRSCMATSGAWRHTLNLWKRPEPRSIGIYKRRNIL